MRMELNLENKGDWKSDVKVSGPGASFGMEWVKSLACNSAGAHITLLVPDAAALLPI